MSTLTDRRSATRARILDAAQALINARGAVSATVEGVMQRAGLTVGGFYGHFASKDALAREALLAGVERSFERLTAGLEGASPPEFAKALIDRYLAQADDPHLESACPLTLLLPDIARGEPALREAFAVHSADLIARVEPRLPAVEGMHQRDVALALFASLAGAVSFARAAATPRGRKRIVGATREATSRWLQIA